MYENVSYGNYCLIIIRHFKNVFSFKMHVSGSAPSSVIGALANVDLLSIINKKKII